MSMDLSGVVITLTFLPDGGHAITGGFGGIPASGEAVAGLKRQKHGGDDDDHAVSGSGQTKRRRRQRGTGHKSSTTDEEAVGAASAACAICLEDFVDGDGLAVMPCAHRFHEGCLTQWLALSRLCPCCRHALPSEGKGGDGEAPEVTPPALATVAEGGGAGAGANGGMLGRTRSGRTRQVLTRRSRRARQANVRLFGPEWAPETSDNGLGLQQ